MATVTAQETNAEAYIDPMRFSMQELEFLLEDDNYRKSAAVALAGGIPEKFIVITDVEGPDGSLRRNRVVTVNDAAVRDLLGRVQRVVELEEAGKLSGKFVGWERVRRGLERALDYHRRRMAAKEYNPREGHPSMYSYDGMGRAHYQGVGSDCGQVVTYIDSKGKRHRFGFSLVEAQTVRGNAAWATMDADEDDVSEEPLGPEGHPELRLIVNDEERYIQCPVCKHVETWKEGSTGTRNVARARMAKHCRGARDEVEAHRLLSKEEFE